MKRPIAAVYILASLTALPFAQEASAEAYFVGALSFVASRNCDAASLVIRSPSAFYPAINGNRNISSLIRYGQFGSTSYTTTSGPFSTTKATKINGVTYKPIPVNFSASVLAIVTPSTITASTDFVRVTGQIKNPENIPGTNGKTCIVDFEATYTRRT